MAKIYTKTISSAGGTSDKSLILDPREALQYPFNIGSDWTEARLGIMMSIVPATDDNAAAAAGESIVTTDATNIWAIGLKDSSTALPWAVGSQFWGFSQTLNAAATTSIAAGYVRASGTTGGVYVLNGATPISTSSNWPDLPCVGAGASSTSYATYIALRFTIANRGLATQTVSVESYHANSGGSFTGDTRISTMRSLLYSTGFPWGLVSGVAWNTGSAARPIPDTIFIRLPFVNNRARIHSMMIERVV